MRVGLPNQIKDNRGQVCIQACVTAAYISQAFGHQKEGLEKTNPAVFLAEQVSDALFSLVKNGKQVIASAGVAALQIFIQNTSSKDCFKKLASKMESKSNTDRLRLVEILSVMLQHWPDKLLKNSVIAEKMGSLVDKALGDKDIHVKKEAKNLKANYDLVYKKTPHKKSKSAAEIKKKINVVKKESFLAPLSKRPEISYRNRGNPNSTYDAQKYHTMGLRSKTRHEFRQESETTQRTSGPQRSASDLQSSNLNQETLQNYKMNRMHQNSSSKTHQHSNFQTKIKPTSYSKPNSRDPSPRQSARQPVSAAQRRTKNQYKYKSLGRNTKIPSRASSHGNSRPGSKLNSREPSPEKTSEFLNVRINTSRKSRIPISNNNSRSNSRNPSRAGSRSSKDTSRAPSPTTLTLEKSMSNIEKSYDEDQIRDMKNK